MHEGGSAVHVKLEGGREGGRETGREIKQKRNESPCIHKDHVAIDTSNTKTKAK